MAIKQPKETIIKRKIVENLKHKSLAHNSFKWAPKHFSASAKKKPLAPIKASRAHKLAAFLPISAEKFVPTFKLLEHYFNVLHIFTWN